MRAGVRVPACMCLDFSWNQRRQRSTAEGEEDEGERQGARERWGEAWQMEAAINGLFYEHKGRPPQPALRVPAALSARGGAGGEGTGPTLVVSQNQPVHFPLEGPPVGQCQAGRHWGGGRPDLRVVKLVGLLATVPSRTPQAHSAPPPPSSCFCLSPVDHSPGSSWV